MTELPQFESDHGTLHRHVKLLKGSPATRRDPRPSRILHERGFLGNHVCRSPEYLANACLILGLQQGQQLVTDPISQDRRILIGGVFAEVPAAFPGDGFELALAEIEQGTEQGNPGIGGRGGFAFHAAQPRSASAAEEPNKHQLRLVIGMVREGHGIGTPFLGGSREKGMTKPPGLHFQGFAGGGSSGG